MFKHLSNFCTKTAVALLVFGLCSSAIWAQSIKIQYKDTPITSILKDVQRHSGYNFVYSNLLEGIENKVSITHEGTASEITDLLSKLFKGTNIIYEIKGKQIALLSSDIKKRE
ncbi:MAG: hypothetical protein IJ296_06375 [Bacteroidales bacterium]|nr:hypothetical protein [Bacteroidales bacterium]